MEKAKLTRPVRQKLNLQKPNKIKTRVKLDTEYSLFLWLTDKRSYGLPISDDMLIITNEQDLDYISYFKIGKNNPDVVFIGLFLSGLTGVYCKKKLFSQFSYDFNKVLGISRSKGNKKRNENETNFLKDCNIVPHFKSIQLVNQAGFNFDKLSEKLDPEEGHFWSKRVDRFI
ncbi:hypothetical protein BpHYR1_021412 [Brachionus plicatilis]|uniref:Uncharacterized protein n=1 Tax=Brachionus plicatilis TaxID=10195 RepID=A0A3M7SQI9_BRAPC|nr:hypothetical protein BpHYR1_021412 [Brachionus plicatilis]